MIAAVTRFEESRSQGSRTRDHRLRCGCLQNDPLCLAKSTLLIQHLTYLFHRAGIVFVRTVMNLRRSNYASD